MSALRRWSIAWYQKTRWKVWLDERLSRCAGVARCRANFLIRPAVLVVLLIGRRVPLEALAYHGDAVTIRSRCRSAGKRRFSRPSPVIVDLTKRQVIGRGSQRCHRMWWTDLLKYNFVAKLRGREEGAVADAEVRGN
jgi:hypothetical protein